MKMNIVIAVAFIEFVLIILIIPALKISMVSIVLILIAIAQVLIKFLVVGISIVGGTTTAVSPRIASWEMIRFT